MEFKQRAKVLEHPRLLTFLGYYSITEMEMCGTFHTVNLVFDYNPSTLENLIAKNEST